MQIVDLKTEGAGLHGVARLTFKCGSENRFRDYHAHIYFICDGYSSIPLLNVSNNDKQIDETKSRIFYFMQPSENDVKIFNALGLFFGKRQTCAFWLCVTGTCASTMSISERHRAIKEILSMWSMEDGDRDRAYA